MKLVINNWTVHLSEQLAAAVEQAAPDNILPAKKDIFRALQLVKPADVRVVILGQDPYHTPGKANGLAFGIHPDFTGPRDYSSFGSILTEVERWKPGAKQSLNQSLVGWAEQGVLLLNTRLSVAPGKPLSHKDWGWEETVASILEQIPEDAVWLLWGSEARKVGEPHARVDRTITCSHPSKYSYKNGTHRAMAFYRSDCFRLANELLGKGKEIDWSR